MGPIHVTPVVGIRDFQRSLDPRVLVVLVLDLGGQVVPASGQVNWCFEEFIDKYLSKNISTSKLGIADT